MKKLICVISVLLLVSCAIAPPKDPVCSKVEGNSFICEKSHELGVEPEQVYGWIYSPTALAVVANKVSINDVCEFEQKVADWYDSIYPDVSYMDVIKHITGEIKLIADPQKQILLMNILNPYLNAYNSVLSISQADDTILRKGHTRFRRDMLCGGSL